MSTSNFVFALLPAHVFEACIWAVLRPEDQSSFRLACRQSVQLVDLLLIATTLSLFVRKAEWADLLADPGRLVHVTHDTPATRALSQAIHRFAAFLKRLPRLAALKLTGGHNVAAVYEALGAVGGPGDMGRVTQLTLSQQPLSTPAFWAICHAFPGLDSLRMESCGVRDPLYLASPGPGVVYGTTLHEVPDLNTCSAVMMRSLVHLRHLRSLHLTVTHLNTAHLRMLRGLRDLRSCFISFHGAGASLAEAASLFHSTGLTSLQILTSHCTDQPDAPTAAVAAADDDTVAAAAAPGQVASPSDDELAAAAALLGGLVNLQLLNFGPRFFADAAVWAALKLLTLLTELRLGGSTAGGEPGPGHLPALQTLRVGTWGAETPSCLLQVLLPLLPLPSLTSLSSTSHFTHPGTGNFAVDISHQQGDQVAVDALASTLAVALWHLAAAPRLQLGLPGQPELTFTSCETPSGWDPDMLSLPQLGDALLPWAEAGRLSRLHLTEMDVPWAGWEELQERLPGVSHLHLSRCGVAPACLAAVVQGWTGLQRLSLDSCWVGGSERRAWVGLAEACAQALVLDVEPRVALGVVGRCRAAQQAMYGEQHIEWVGCPPMAVVDGEVNALEVEDGSDSRSDGDSDSGSGSDSLSSNSSSDSD